MSAPREAAVAEKFQNEFFAHRTSFPGISKLQAPSPAEQMILGDFQLIGNAFDFSPINSPVAFAPGGDGQAPAVTYFPEDTQGPENVDWFSQLLERAAVAAAEASHC
ncbi:MAG TPA: hypothetical protein V6D17_08035 [Candidatus Obscuribacterales bacterium]